MAFALKYRLGKFFVLFVCVALNILFWDKVSAAACSAFNFLWAALITFPLDVIRSMDQPYINNDATAGHENMPLEFLQMITIFAWLFVIWWLSLLSVVFFTYVLAKIIHGFDSLLGVLIPRAEKKSRGTK